jgi:hypothetical protein
VLLELTTPYFQEVMKFCRVCQPCYDTLNEDAQQKLVEMARVARAFQMMKTILRDHAEAKGHTLALQAMQQAAAVVRAESVASSAAAAGSLALDDTATCSQSFNKGAAAQPQQQEALAEQLAAAPSLATWLPDVPMCC